MGTRRAGERDMQRLLQARLHAAEKIIGERFRGFFRKVAPNLDKVYLCRFGKAEAEWSANSFLPRAMILFASN
jgi:hypothetical protein